MEGEEGVPPPWIRMVKKSSYAGERDGQHGGGGEEGGLAPPWVRMVKKRQEPQQGSNFPQMNNRPGLWGMAAIRSLKKRELGEKDKAWMLRMTEKDGD